MPRSENERREGEGWGRVESRDFNSDARVGRSRRIKNSLMFLIISLGSIQYYYIACELFYYLAFYKLETRKYDTKVDFELSANDSNVFFRIDRSERKVKRCCDRECMFFSPLFFFFLVREDRFKGSKKISRASLGSRPVVG